MITLIGNTSLTKLEKYINDVNLIGSFYVQEGRETQALGYVYTLRLIAVCKRSFWVTLTAVHLFYNNNNNKHFLKTHYTIVSIPQFP